MKSPTVNYPRNASYPPMRRRRKGGSGMGCTCDGNYAKSLQGICKLFAIIVELLIIIIIGVSPYWKQIFVIGGEVWPFHIVMLITSLMFIATLLFYGLFLSGMHLSHPSIAWPKMELLFNIVLAVFALIAACVEAANVWRWDLTQGYQQGFNFNSNGGAGGFDVQGSQIFGGNTLSGSLNFNSYCARYPKDCQDYVALLTGNNTYFGNHVFGTILLFLLLICYLVATFFAYRTWRVFRRDMVKDRPEGAPLPPPSAWERFRYRISEIKVPKVNADNIKDRFTNLLKRDDDEVEGNVDLASHDPKSNSLPPYSEKPIDQRSHHGSSTYKSSSSQHGRSSRHSRSSSDRHRDHRDDYDEKRSHHSSSRHDRRSENRDRRSHRSGSESRSSKRRSEHQHQDKYERRDDSTKKKESSRKSNSKDKAVDESEAMAPVASVMC